MQPTAMTSSKPQTSEPMMAAVMTESCEANKEKHTAMKDLWNILTLAHFVIYHVKYHYLQYFYLIHHNPPYCYNLYFLSSNRKISVLKDYHEITIITKPLKISFNQAYLTL